MKQRRGVLALFVLSVVSSSIAPCAEQGRQEEGRGAEEGNPEHRQNRRRSHGRAAGRRTISAAWLREDVLKAQGNKEYVPFTVQIDPSKVTGRNVAFYWRSWRRAAARRRPPTDAKKDDKKDKDKDKKKPIRLRGHQLRAGDRRPDADAASRAPSRSPAGTYDVFVVAKEPTPEKAPKNAPPPKIPLSSRR